MNRAPNMITAPARCLSAAALAVLLSGCAAAVVTPAPRRMAAVAGVQTALVDGREIQGEIRPGPTGMQLTRAGARPVSGQEIRIAGLRNDQGALAKKAARTICAAAGGSFSGEAIGGFGRSGNWTFPGGCA